MSKAPAKRIKVHGPDGKLVEVSADVVTLEDGRTMLEYRCPRTGRVKKNWVTAPKVRPQEIAPGAPIEPAAAETEG